MASRHRWYFGGFLVAALLLFGAVLLGAYEVLSVLAAGPPATGEGLVLAMLGAAAEWIVLSLLFGLLAVVFLCASVVSVLRSKSLPRSDRLVSVVEHLERRYPILERLDVSKRVEPTLEDRKRRLEQRYVSGEIDEAEFEREMERLLDEQGESRTDGRSTGEVDRPSRERRR